MTLRHRGCGGPVVADNSKMYEHDLSELGSGGPVEMVPAYRCTYCGHEILGDSELIVPNELVGMIPFGFTEGV